MKRVLLGKLHWDEAYGLYLDTGVPFTGVAFTNRLDGTLESESEYVDGLQSGISRAWHKNGALAAEGTYLDGNAHGVNREWHENGQLSLEKTCEFGILLRQQSWDEQGNVVENYTIDEGGGDWQLLEQCREIARAIGQS